MHESSGSKNGKEKVRPNYENWAGLEIKGPLLKVEAGIPKKYARYMAPMMAIATVPILAGLKAPWFTYLVVAIIGILPFIVDRMRNAKTEKKDSQGSFELGNCSWDEGEAGPSNGAE